MSVVLRSFVSAGSVNLSLAQLQLESKLGLEQTSVKIFKLLFIEHLFCVGSAVHKEDFRDSQGCVQL